ILRGGQHVLHRFTSEHDHDRETQRALTQEYGWNVLCNGRLILSSDKTPKTGWKAWHSEYNGFVGEVSFCSDDARLLPWNTTKTDILETAPCYQEALERMQEITSEWRTQWRKMRKYSRTAGSSQSSSKPTKGRRGNKRSG